MNAYCVNSTRYSNNMYIVVADNIGEVEKLWKENYPGSVVEGIEMISKYVIVKGIEK